MPHHDENAVMKAIAVTAELTQTGISADAIFALDKILTRYPVPIALKALERCQMEVLPGRFCAAEVISRINEHDGRPSSDEAWALCAKAADERETVVWSDEMREAFAIARPLLDSHEGGKNIAARMAFKDAYERIVREARARSLQVRWEVSIGWDQDLRVRAINDALLQKRLAPAYANALMPAPKDAGAIVSALMHETKMIAGPQDKLEQKPLPKSLAERVAGIKAALRQQTDDAAERRGLVHRREAENLASKKAAVQSAVDERLLTEARAPSAAG